MKKLVLLSLLLLVSTSCSKAKNYFTVYAQSFPVTKTFVWTAPVVDATHGQVESYVVKLGNTTIGTPTATTQQFTINAPGTYTLSVAASNVWGTSSPATLTFTAAFPGNATGLGIQ